MADDQIDDQSGLPVNVGHGNSTTMPPATIAEADQVLPSEILDDASPAAPPSPVTPQASSASLPPPVADDQIVSNIIKARQQTQEMALRQSMLKATQTDPDTMAKALPIAAANGIPLDMAARNLTELQKTFDFNETDYQQMLKDYPKLSSFLSNPDNAAVAHDDIPALQSLSDWAGAQKSMMEDPLNPLSHMAALGSGTAKSIGQVMEFAGQGLQNLSKDQGSPEDAVDRFLISGRQAIEGGIGSTLSFSGQSWSTLGDIIDAPQQDFIHNIERFAGMLPPVMAVAAANPAAVGPVFGAMMGGQVYQKAKAMGLDLNSTKVNAAAVAAFGVGTLLGPAGKMALSAIPEGASIGLRNVADAIATKIGAAPGTATADALARTGNYAAHIVGTTAAMAGYTLAQNAIYREMLGDEKTDFTTGLPDSMTMGGFAGLVAAIMDHGMALTKNYHDTVSVPAMTKESLAQGGQLMQESKTFGRSPETANAYLNQELGNNDLHVRPAAFQTFFQKIDPDAQKAILAKMPELADDLQDSLKTGEDLKVNQADYHSYIQPHAPELDQWMRLRPETWSEGDRLSYEKMMQEIIPADEGNGENAVHNNLYNQLIQRYGQRTAPTGIPDIADSLGAWLQNSHDTLMAKYGHIPGAADFLHSMIGNMKILREYPELGAHMMKDPSFDTFIDKVRNEQVKGASPPKMRTVTGKDGIEKQVAVKPRGQRSPTPIIDYLASKGGVRRGSDLEKDLSGRGITRSTMAKLFNKLEPTDVNQGSLIRGKVDHNQDKYGLRNFDEINARELEGSAGHSTRDRENSDFVDKDWLLEQVEKEANGEVVDEAQAHHDAAAEDMLNALDHEGVDITKATNEQVKAALDRVSKNYAAESNHQVVHVEQKPVDKALEENPKMADKVEELAKESVNPPEFKPEVKPAPIEEQVKAEDIKDFGEKIAGAKKDLWKDYKKALSEDLPADAKDITLSKHFPEPDYEALIAQGVDTKSLAAVKAMRDTIPAKPKLDYKLQRWADQVKVLREFSSNILDGKHDVNYVISKMESAGSGLSELVKQIKLYSDLGYPTFLKADGYRVNLGSYSSFYGQEFNPPKSLWTVGKRGAFASDRTGYDTRQAAVDALRARLDLESAPTRTTKLDLYQVTKTGEIVIGKKVGSGKFIDLKKGFTSVKEARQYLKDNEPALLALLEKKKEVPPERKSTNDPRVGNDYRMGDNVTPEKFAGEFGFRGVQFGNYVEQARRTNDLNNAYDALLDLSTVIGVPSRAMSLDGTLGLAFGARGSGGKNAAAAHYESDHVVINLTKDSGFGSLGHEWWHALDSYFGKKIGGSDSFLTANLKGGEAIRPEVTAAYKGVIEAIRKTELPKRSKELDTRKTKDYWGTNIEMSARAFESYLIEKAKEQGNSNDYLANVLGEEVHKSLYGAEEPYSYPTKDEMKVIGPAFDHLFETLKTKEGENGAQTFYQRGGNVRKGPDLEELQGRWVGKKYGGVETSIYESDDGIHLGKIEVDKDKQKQGYGTKVMQELVDYADRTGQRITLSPGTDFGGSSVNRLKGFYKRFGFVENKGKNKDFTTQESMFRDPQVKTSYQGGDDGPRGSVTFGPDNETTVRLFSRERLDTLLHEFGHIYWRALSKIAELPGGEEAAKDVAAMKDWVTKDPDYLHKYITKYNPYEVAKTEAGYEVRNNQKTVEAFHTEAAAEAKSKALYADLLKEYEDKGGPEWLKTQKYGVAETDLENHAQTAIEEKLADSFLSYLKTGKSPSVEMIPTFDKFQSWLGRLYDGVKDTLPKINPEVKDVFDRMFATAEQIHGMRNQPEFSPDPSLMAVLNKPDRERYARQYDRMISDAQNRLLREALRQSERSGNKQYKEARAGIKDEMQSRADGERRYQAMDTIIKTGGLDKKDLVKEYGKEILPYLEKHGLVAKKGGVRPGPIATIHGYDTARDMITDFMNTPKKKDYVKDQTDQEMIARHGDMLHDGTIEREAVAAYHNNLRAEALGWEMKKMAAMAKLPAPSPEAIKAKAYTMLGDRVLGTVRPYSFYRAEVRAAHEVGKALAKKDYAAAAVAKGKQLLNHHLYKMAADAKESQNRSMDKWSDILRRPDKKLAKGYDIDFIYAARKILGDHDFATGGNFQDLNTWQQRLLEVDPDAAKNIQDILFAAATSDNKPVNKMTWSEFQGLRDSINGLIEQAKGQNTLEIEGRKIEKKEVRATLIDGPLTGKTLADGTPVRAGGLADMDPVMDFDDLRHQSEGRKDKAKKALLGGAMHFMRMEKWVEAMDGGKFDGPIRQLIYQPVRKALDNYLSKTNDNLQIARDILGHVDLLGDQIKAPELKVYDKTGEPINGGKGYTFANKGELIGALVHHGNGFDPGSNGYKLVRGNGWHQADWQAFLDRAMQDGTITKVDMDTVQKLWNMMDGMRPDIWRAHKDMYGFYPKEIASVPFQTPFGEYKGGYWPVKYDPAKDDHLAAAYEKDALTSDSRHAWPTTGKSSTMDRDPSFSRPIQMKLEFLPAHIDWAMRFAHLEPAVREAAKIMFDPEIRKAIDRVNPRVRENVILPWLKRTVRQDMDLSSGGTMREFSGVTNFIKDSFYMKTLGLNLRYPLQRVGEIGPIAHDTSWSSVMRAFGDLVRDNEGTRGEISQSPFMHTRAIWFEDNAAKQLRNLIVDRNPYEKIADFSKAHAFYTVRETHRWLDEIQWLASKYHALEGKADGVNPDNMQQVMDYADSRVRGSQATFGPGDVSDIEGGSAGLRAVWNIFYSVMNTKLNAALADARLVLGKDTPIPVRAVGLASVFINRLMIPMFISDSIMRLINTLGPTDQKGHHSVLAWAESAAFDGIKSVASLVPLGSAAADQLLPLFKDIGDKAYNDTLSIAPAAQMMFKDVFENMPKHLYEAIFHNGSKQKAFDSLFTAAGDLLRVPFTPVKRAIDYGAAVHQGKQHPDNGLEMVRGILGGPNIKK